MFPRVAKRPATLTNRGCCSSDQGLAKILRTPDQRLRWSDYSEIFPISACAGAYEEQLYFVPLAFEHLAREPADGLEYAAGFLQFFVRNSAALERDGLDAAARDAAEALVPRWTSSFEVVHYDKAACWKKGWSVDYRDLVKSSHAVGDFLSLLLQRPFFAEAGERAVRSLLAAGSVDTQAAWFLEISRAFHDGEIGLLSQEPLAPADRVRDLLTTPSVLRDQYERIRSSPVVTGSSPSYWRDVLVTIGLEIEE